MRTENLKILLVIFLLFFVKVDALFSQTYTIKGERNVFNGFLYNIHEDNTFEKDSLVHYSVTLGKTTKGGFRLSQEIGDNCLLIKDLSDKPIAIRDNGFEIIIGHNIYTENIKAYELLVFGENGKPYAKKFELTTDKLQYPTYNSFSDWQYLCGQEEKIGFLKSITRIGIRFYKRTEDYPSLLLLTDFAIYESKKDTINVNHPFFDKLTGFNSMIEPGSNSLSYDGIIAPFTKYTMQEISSDHLYITTEEQNNTIIYSDVFSYLLENYPFYEAKGINKTAFLTDFHKHSSGVVSEDEYLEMIDSLLKYLNDPHFQLINFNPEQRTTRSALKAGPIRLFQIKGRYHIASCFDSTLLEKINLGNEVIAIDGENINQVMQEEIKDYTGNFNARQDWALSRLLFKSKNDSTLLTYIVNSEDTVSLTLYYNTDYKIPDNFRAIHNEYKYYDSEGVLYIRLNNWQAYDYITFLNHLDEINACKGIVFDLRNNGGGHGRETELIASCFLSKPTVFMHQVCGNLKESQVVFPNPEIKLTNKRVVILGNSRTACASEGFIALMKNYDNTFFISDNSTSGNYANRYQLIFPSGIGCAIDGLYISHFKDYGVIEERGFEPDIWVHINHVNDLAPYEDKLLKTAIKLIDY